MKDKWVITLNTFEHNLLINGFNEFRNKLLMKANRRKMLTDCF